SAPSSATSSERRSRMRFTRAFLCTGWLIAAGCGDDSNKACDLANPTAGCMNGQVCEEVAGSPACAAPLGVRGKVVDPGGAGIAGALVLALDANDAPASGTATT